MIGAAIAGRAAARLTVGGAIVASGFLQAIGMLVAPAAVLIAQPIPLLAVTGTMFGIADSVLSINQISLRQRITPTHLLGRVTAARRFLIFCTAPAGVVVGGWMGSRAGFEATMVAGGCVVLVASLYMWHSPIRTAK